MRPLFAILAIAFLAGCNSVPRPQKGGSSTITPNVATVQQPENPQGVTRQTLTREWLVPPAPDQPLILREQADTIIGGSQAQADIIKAAAAHKGAIIAMLVGMLYLVLGYMAWRREWPTIAIGLAGSGVLGMATAWTLPALAPASLIIGPVLASGIWFAFKTTRSSILP
jgi:hypothetical protein